MKTKISFSSILAFSLIALSAYMAKAQSSNGVLKGSSVAYNYPPIREADVMWMKRIWRRIDVRQKMNHKFLFPDSPSNGRMAFFEYLTRALSEGSIVAYDPGPLGDDDSFAKALTNAQVKEMLLRKEMLVTERLDGSGFDTLYQDNPIKPSEVLMFELKEDWFFDKQRSVMEVRIVGICPMIQIRDEDTGEFRGYKKLFWINYQEARSEFAYWETFNNQNDAEYRTFDQVFTKRIFDSFIVKESNVYDRYVFEYAKGLDALMESERIEQKLFEKEHDLWNY